MTPYAPQLQLAVYGFPEATQRTDNQGQKLLVTRTEVTSPPLSHVHIALRGLPTPGPARYLATCIAGFAVLAGLGFAVSSSKGGRPANANRKTERQQLLADLEELERACRDGEIGPQTYEKARRELIDAIARTLAPGERESST